MTTVALLALAWMALAVVLGVVMGRRGYNGFGWGVVGAVLGPIAVLIAVTRHVPARSPHEEQAAGSPGPGSVDVLVAVDGSEAAIAAARRAVDLFARRLGAVTIATVIPLDATVDDSRRAQQALADAVGALSGRLMVHSVEPKTLVLHGAAAESLRDAAMEGGADVIVVGSQGRGMATFVLGSVAAALSRSAPVPVLIGERQVEQVEGGPVPSATAFNALS